MTCPKCGQENPEGARFCLNCGNELKAEPAREERKVVTVLFADLVGFTSRAEQMDPEDVRAILEPYHARLRTELERRGGTVEKFIGDAVMALFGAPTAHEDDPERAVRAALAIRDWIREENDLQVRVAVTTGEALVALGARPTEGEGMASGDVVNTAARLQSVAPVNGILVDETTYRATDQKIDSAESEPVTAKGKQEPVPAWEVIDARSSYGVDVGQAQRAPLIGREREVDVLVSALERVRAERSPQLVTLVGVPGIGKSRLVYELSQVIEGEAELTNWRQGRSLPYGEGVSFWALSEMVKAQAGILETDSSEETARKLARSIRALVDDDSEAEWVERHLGTLIGLESEQDLRGDHRAEAFAAWRRFFEGIADQRPLVLVFEDLHWADEALLDFVDHLVDWAGGVPILVVCTARPELLSRRAGWGGGKPNALTLSLSPLDDDQTARLLGALLERSVLPVDTQTALLQRAGGNPLYAEEFVRMVTDRELVAGAGELPMPESVQGIVAARLDALPEEEKTLLQDASVLGKVFWLGAAAEIGGRDRTAVEAALHRLERKEFVRRERRPSVAGESEYVFGHLLVRDVAYGQIPRARRAEKHRLAGEWIEKLGRHEDHAEMLAHHYSTALELARAAGADTVSLEGPARTALAEAGDRAYALSAFPTARRFYAAALEVWPEDEPPSPGLLIRYGRVLNSLALGDASGVLERAIDVALSSGDRGAAAEAEALLCEMHWLMGRRDAAFEHLRVAEELVETEPSSYAKAYVMASASRFWMLAASDDAIRVGLQALAMAEELGLEELQAHALDNIGVSRLGKDDEQGFADLERSIAIADSINSVESARAYGNLASALADFGELERGFEMLGEARRRAERFGLDDWLLWLRGEVAYEPYCAGKWDEAFRQLDELIYEFEEHPFWMETPCRLLRGRMRLARGDTTGAIDDAERSLELARVAKDPQVLWPALAFTARIAAPSDPDRARLVVEELLSEWRAQHWPRWSESDWLADAAFVLPVIGGERPFLEGLAEPGSSSPWRKAALAYVSGDPRATADVFGGMGVGPEEAFARLRAAELLVGEGRRAEADDELERALAFWRAVSATAYVREGEALLAEAG